MEGPDTAEQRWSAVVALARPVPLAKAVDGRKKSPEEIRNDINKQAERSRQAAEAARQFHLQNPGHPKAAEARKIEALSAIRGVPADDTAIVDDALSRARSLRNDTSLPLGDRLEVALAMDRLELSLSVKSRTGTGTLRDYLNMAHKLRAEFGDQPALQDYYIELASTADFQVAATIAELVGQSSAARPRAKAQAEAILDRGRLLGKPLRLTVPLVEGGHFNLSEQTGKVTAIILWSARSPDALSELRTVAGSFPVGTQFVYIALGFDKAVVERVMAKPEVPGWNCYVPPGIDAATIARTMQLKHTTAPYSFVLDENGRVAAFGPLRELRSMLQAANDTANATAQ